jgi:hypothetical protein
MSQKNRKGLSGGKRFGKPPEKGPNPQGINSTFTKESSQCYVKRSTNGSISHKLRQKA